MFTITAGDYYKSNTKTKWGEEKCQLATPELTYNNETRWHFIFNQTLPTISSGETLWINYIQHAYLNPEGKT